MEKYAQKLFKTNNLLIRQFLAEIISTFIFVTFCCGSIAQLVLDKGRGRGSFFSASFSGGLGATAGILVGGKVSGIFRIYIF